MILDLKDSCEVPILVTAFKLSYTLNILYYFYCVGALAIVFLAQVPQTRKR